MPAERLPAAQVAGQPATEDALDQAHLRGGQPASIEGDRQMAPHVDRAAGRCPPALIGCRRRSRD